MATKKKFLNFKLPELVFVILLIVSCFSLGFSGGGFFINFQKVGFTVVSTFEKGINSVGKGISGIFTNINEIHKLKKENAELKEKLANYENMKRSNTEIKKENDRLREQLDFAKSIQTETISAQIIGREPNNIYSGLTINKGSRHGIKKGMSVIANQNGTVGVVGKVVTVGIGTSIIMPVYDTKCNISSRIQNTRDLGLVTGNGSSSSPLKLRYIRKRVMDDLHYGDIVVTSGENDNYLADVPIGRISRIESVDYDSSLLIELDSIVDFSRLENVLVVVK